MGPHAECFFFVELSVDKEMRLDVEFPISILVCGLKYGFLVF